MWGQIRDRFRTACAFAGFVRLGILATVVNPSNPDKGEKRYLLEVPATHNENGPCGRVEMPEVDFTDAAISARRIFVSKSVRS